MPSGFLNFALQIRLLSFINKVKKLFLILQAKIINPQSLLCSRKPLPCGFVFHQRFIICTESHHLATNTRIKKDNLSTRQSHKAGA